MKFIRECLLLSFLAIVHGNNNFPVAIELMEPYSRNGPLSNIQWQSFRDFENEWKSAMVTTRVKSATADKLNSFFNKMDIALNSHHRAMDSIVARCRAAEKVLPRLTARKDLSSANKEMTRFKNAFAESKTHLDALKYNLEAALEFLSDIDPQYETSNEKRFIITDFNNGTVMFQADEELYDHPDILRDLFRALSARPFSSRSPVVYLNDFHTGARHSGSAVDKRQPMGVAFFARVENIKNQLYQIIRQIDSGDTNIADKLNNFIESDVLPSDEEIEELLRKCENYRPLKSF